MASGGEGRPRVWSERWARFALNLYPPYLFSCTRVRHIGAGFRSCRVRVTPSLLTRNLQGTIFGGTIYAAADPFHALLYWQIFAHQGLRVQGWTRSSRIEFLRPANSRLELEFVLTEEDVAAARAAIEREGHFQRTHRTEAIDRRGRVCAVIETQVDIRLPGAKRRSPEPKGTGGARGR